MLVGVTVLTGNDEAPIEDAIVRLDEDGIVAAIEPGAAQASAVLIPPAVDLHLDVVPERRRPRANVVLDIEQTVVTLDAELVASGIGTVCIAARFEDEPIKGVEFADAIALCEVVERLAPDLVCDWWIHARVEITEERGPAALEDALSRTARIALISVMDHSAERTRFASYEEHVDYYARDWGLAPDEVERTLARMRAGAAEAPERRERIARIATQAGITLATHDDRTAEDAQIAYHLGARVSEFPVTLEAAQVARELGLATILGAPNAVRGRSTSPSNLTVTEAVTAGACDALCSDYLPSALLRAPFVLSERDGIPLADAVSLATRAPAQLLGRPAPTIEVGRPLEAVAVRRHGAAAEAIAIWRDGRLAHLRRAVGGVGAIEAHLGQVV